MLELYPPMKSVHIAAAIAAHDPLGPLIYMRGFLA